MLIQLQILKEPTEDREVILTVLYRPDIEDALFFRICMLDLTLHRLDNKGALHYTRETLVADHCNACSYMIKRASAVMRNIPSAFFACIVCRLALCEASGFHGFRAYLR